MGGVGAENGYTGMHVTDIAFEDEKNGTITVSMAYGNGAADSLSCLFTTTDGGETWSAVTSGDRTYPPGGAFPWRCTKATTAPTAWSVPR